MSAGRAAFVDDAIAAGLHLPGDHGGRHAVTLASLEAVTSTLRASEFGNVDVELVPARVTAAHAAVTHRVLIPQVSRLRLAAHAPDSEGSADASLLARLRAVAASESTLPARVERVLQEVHGLRVGDPLASSQLVLTSPEAWEEVTTPPTSVLCEPATASAASTAKALFTARSDSTLRFRPGTAACVRFTLSPEAASFTHLEVVFDRDAAPAVVFLQLAELPEGATLESLNDVAWMVADSVALVNHDPAQLYGPSVTARDTLPTMHRGVLLSRWQGGEGGEGSIAPVAPTARAVRLYMYGLHGTNSKRAMGIATLRLWRAPRRLLEDALTLRGGMHVDVDDGPLPAPLLSATYSVPTRTVLDYLVHWLYSVSTTAAREDVGLLTSSLSALAATSIASSSAHAFLATLSAAHSIFVSTAAPAVRVAVVRVLRSCRLALARMLGLHHRRDAAKRWASGLGTRALASTRGFDPAFVGGSPIALSAGNVTASSLEAPDVRAYVLGNSGFPMRGRSSWTLRLDVDRENDECVALGFAVRPVRDPNYETSADIWSIRCYNARVYGRVSTRVMGSIPHGPIHAGSEVTFTLEGAARTVSVAVDGVSQGVVFTLPSDDDLNASTIAAVRASGGSLADVAPPLIHPCACFYGAARSVSLVAVSSGEPTIDLALPVPLTLIPVSPSASSATVASARSAKDVALIGGIACGEHLPAPGINAVVTARPPSAAPAPRPTDAVASITAEAAIPSDRICIGGRLYSHCVSLAPDSRVLACAARAAIAQAWANYAGADAAAERWVVTSAARFNVGGGFEWLTFGVGLHGTRAVSRAASGDDDTAVTFSNDLCLLLVGDGVTRHTSGTCTPFRKVLFSSSTAHASSLLWGDSDVFPPTAGVKFAVDGASHAPDTFRVDVAGVHDITVLVVSRVRAQLSHVSVPPASLEGQTVGSVDAYAGEIAKNAVSRIVSIVHPMLGPALCTSAPTVQSVLLTSVSPGDAIPVLEAPTPLSSAGDAAAASTFSVPSTVAISSDGDTADELNIWGVVSQCLAHLAALGGADTSGADAAPSDAVRSTWLQSFCINLLPVPGLATAVRSVTSVPAPAAAVREPSRAPPSAATASHLPSWMQTATGRPDPYTAAAERGQLAAAAPAASRFEDEMAAAIAASMAATAAPRTISPSRSVYAPTVGSTRSMDDYTPEQVAMLLGIEGELDADTAAALLMSMEGIVPPPDAPVNEPAAAPAAAPCPTPVVAAVSVKLTPCLGAAAVLPACVVPREALAEAASGVAAADAPASGASAVLPSRLEVSTALRAGHRFDDSARDSLLRTVQQTWQSRLMQRQSVHEYDFTRGAVDAMRLVVATTGVRDPLQEGLPGGRTLPEPPSSVSPVNTPMLRSASVEAHAVSDDVVIPYQLEQGSSLGVYDLNLLHLVTPMLRACASQVFGENDPPHLLAVIDSAVLLAAIIRYSMAVCSPLPPALSDGVCADLQEMCEVLLSWRSPAMTEAERRDSDGHTLRTIGHIVTSETAAAAVVAALPVAYRAATGRARLAQQLHTPAAAAWGAHALHDCIAAWLVEGVREHVIPVTDMLTVGEGDVDMLPLLTSVAHADAHEVLLRSWQAAVDVTEYVCCLAFAMPLARRTLAAAVASRPGVRSGLLAAAAADMDGHALRDFAQATWTRTCAWTSRLLRDNARAASNMEAGLRQLAAMAMTCGQNSHFVAAGAAGACSLVAAWMEASGGPSEVKAGRSARMTQWLGSSVMTCAHDGNRDDFTGALGYTFEVASTQPCVVLTAVGRSVRNGQIEGTLQRSHVVGVWEDTEQLLLTYAVLDASAVVDDCGYAVVALHDPITLYRGRRYRIACTEVAGSGDAWFDCSGLPASQDTRGHFDTSLIQPLTDCYVSEVDVQQAGVLQSPPDVAKPALGTCLQVDVTNQCSSACASGATFVGDMALRFPYASTGKRLGYCGVTMFCAPTMPGSVYSPSVADILSDAAAMCISASATLPPPSRVGDHVQPWLALPLFQPLLHERQLVHAVQRETAPQSIATTTDTSIGPETAVLVVNESPLKLFQQTEDATDASHLVAFALLSAAAARLHADASAIRLHCPMVAMGLLRRSPAQLHALAAMIEEWLQGEDGEARLTRGKRPEVIAASWALLASLILLSGEAAHTALAQALRTAADAGALNGVAVPASLLSAWKRVKAVRAWLRGRARVRAGAEGVAEHKEESDRGTDGDSKEESSQLPHSPSDPSSPANVQFSDRVARYELHEAREAAAELRAAVKTSAASPDALLGFVQRAAFVATIAMMSRTLKDLNSAGDAAASSASPLILAAMAYVRYGSTVPPAFVLEHAVLATKYVENSVSSWDLSLRLLHALTGQPETQARVIAAMAASMTLRRSCAGEQARAFRAACRANAAVAHSAYCKALLSGNPSTGSSIDASVSRIPSVVVACPAFVTNARGGAEDLLLPPPGTQLDLIPSQSDSSVALIKPCYVAVPRRVATACVDASGLLSTGMWASSAGHKETITLIANELVHACETMSAALHLGGGGGGDSNGPAALAIPAGAAATSWLSDVLRALRHVSVAHTSAMLLLTDAVAADSTCVARVRDVHAALTSATSANQLGTALVYVCDAVVSHVNSSAAATSQVDLQSICSKCCHPAFSSSWVEDIRTGAMDVGSCLVILHHISTAATRVSSSTDARPSWAANIDAAYAKWSSGKIAEADIQLLLACIPAALAWMNSQFTPGGSAEVSTDGVPVSVPAHFGHVAAVFLARAIIVARNTLRGIHRAVERWLLALCGGVQPVRVLHATACTLNAAYGLLLADAEDDDGLANDSVAAALTPGGADSASDLRACVRELWIAARANVLATLVPTAEDVNHVIPMFSLLCTRVRDATQAVIEVASEPASARVAHEVALHAVLVTLMHMLPIELSLRAMPSPVAHMLAPLSRAPTSTSTSEAWASIIRLLMARVSPRVTSLCLRLLATISCCASESLLRSVTSAAATHASRDAANVGSVMACAPSAESCLAWLLLSLCAHVGPGATSPSATAAWTGHACASVRADLVEALRCMCSCSVAWFAQASVAALRACIVAAAQTAASMGALPPIAPPDAIDLSLALPGAPRGSAHSPADSIIALKLACLAFDVFSPSAGAPVLRSGGRALVRDSMLRPTDLDLSTHLYNANSDQSNAWFATLLHCQPGQRTALAMPCVSATLEAAAAAAGGDACRVSAELLWSVLDPHGVLQPPGVDAPRCCALVRSAADGTRRYTLVAVCASLEEVDMNHVFPASTSPAPNIELLGVGAPPVAMWSDQHALVAAVQLACLPVDSALETLRTVAGSDGAFSQGARAVLATLEHDLMCAAAKRSALGVLEAGLRVDGFMKAFMSSGRLAAVTETAVYAVPTPTFVCTAQFTERAHMLELALQDSACADAVALPSDDAVAALVAAMTAGPARFTPGHGARAARPHRDERASSSDASASAAESAEDMQRRAQAQVLVSMGFGFDLDACMFALRRLNDDMNRTADWLLTPEARRVLSQVAEARQQAAAARGGAVGEDAGATLAAASALGLSTHSVGTSTLLARDAARSSKAEELASIWGMPPAICFQALLTHQDDANAAMSWLMDQGATYLIAMQNEIESGRAAEAEARADAESRRADAASDGAALEPVPESASLQLIPASTAGREGDGSSDGSAAAPVTAVGPSLAASAWSVTSLTPHQMLSHRAAVGEPLLRLEATSAARATAGGITCVSRFKGAVDSLHGSPLHLTPVLRILAASNTSRECAVVYMDHATGVPRWAAARTDLLRTSVALYGVTAPSPLHTLQLLSGVHAAAAIRSTRRFLGSLLAQLAPSKALPLDALGGGEQFVYLVKLAAATSGIFTSATLAAGGDVDYADEGDSSRGSGAAAAGIASAARGDTSRSGRTRGATSAASNASPALGGRSGGAGTPSPSTLGAARPRVRSGSATAQLQVTSTPPLLPTADGSGSWQDVDHVGSVASATRTGGLHSFREALVRALVREVQEKSLSRTASTSSSGVSSAAGTRAQRSILSALAPAWAPDARVRSSLAISSLMNPAPVASPADGVPALELDAPSPVPAALTIPPAVVSASAPSPTPLPPPLWPSALPASPAAGVPHTSVQSPAMRAIGLGDDAPAPASPLFMPISTPFLRSLSSGDPSDAGGAPPSLALASAASSSSSGTGRTRLAQLLLDQCVNNFIITTARTEGAGADRVIVESLHPFYHRCDYVREIVCEGAKALRITFDPRCELARDGSLLTFYSDRNCSTVLATYPVRVPGGSDPLRAPASFPPLVVQSERVYYRFQSSKQEGVNHGWGYRMYAAPMRGLQWSNEGQVAADSSLEWACWLLEFLLHDAGRHSREIFDAVHHKGIFDALVRYLRTPGNPYKVRVASLLTQLLACPTAFNAAAVPDLAQLLPVADMIVARARRDADSGRIFLPPPLLKMVELASAAYLAERAFQWRAARSGSFVGVGALQVRVVPSFGSRGELLVRPAPSVDVPVGEELQSTKHALMDVADLCDVLGAAPSVAALDRVFGSVSHALCAWEADSHARWANSPLPIGASRAPDRLLCRTWLDGCASVRVVESSHPYRDEECSSGVIVIPNATRVRIAVDRRTDVAVGCTLRFRNGSNMDLLTLCGPMTSAAAGTVRAGGATRRGDMKSWLKAGSDVMEIPGDRVAWEFKAVAADGTASMLVHEPTSSGGAVNALGLWGFAFTVSAVSNAVAPGSLAAKPLEAALLRAASDENSTTETIASPLAAPVAAVAASLSSGMLPSLSTAAVWQALWPREWDELLVQWINAHSLRSNGDEESAADVSAAGSGGSRRMVASGVDMHAADLRPSRKQWRFAYEVLSQAPLHAMFLRVATLRYFNRRLQRIIEMVDLASPDAAAAALLPLAAAFGAPASSGATLSRLLRGCKHLVFHEVKVKLIEAAVAATWFTGASSRMPVNRPSITIDNMRAMSSAEGGSGGDITAGGSVFAQAYRQLVKLGAPLLSMVLRTPMDDRGRIFTVKYAGEEGIDYGGVMRDCCARMIDDLHSSRIDLFLPCPNARSTSMDATNSDKFLPNPLHATSLRAQSMYEFVGKLMGMSLRSKLALPFLFPSLVWKALTGQTSTLTDLWAVDAVTADLIARVSNWSCAAGVAAEEPAFAAAFDPGALVYSTRMLDGSRLELLPGCAERGVTLAERGQWVELMLNAHLTCYDGALRAMRRGLYSIVPARGVRCLNWTELEVAVAGRPDIDLKVLKEHTDYEGYRPTDSTIVYFWKVMEEMSNDERSLFVRFAWGRSRLPTTKRWPKRMKLSRRPGGEDQLPVAHTCFNHVELSPASSLERMRWALMTAIHFGNGGILAA